MTSRMSRLPYVTLPMIPGLARRYLKPPSCVRLGRCASYVPIVALSLLLLHMLLLDYIIYTVYVTFVDISSAPNVMTIVSKYPVLRKLVERGKRGGFAGAQTEILDRLFIVSEEKLMTIRTSDNDSHPKLSLSSVGIDVSSAGEATFIYQRILHRRSFPYAHLVVDIGANDGFLSSNSYNFLQWGWNAMLVEPQPYQMMLAQINTMRFNMRADGQKVWYVQAAMSDQDGAVQFEVSPDLVAQQSHIASVSNNAKNDNIKINVTAYTVATLCKMVKIPTKFAILSIDVEGVGFKVLKQWMSLGYRPAYIIYEWLHAKDEASEYLRRFGYRHITRRGWNDIYEHEVKPGET